MARFRKKTIDVEAWRNLPGADDGMPDWVADAVVRVEDGAIAIETLEGIMCADPGDWIIQGVEGEVYPCKPGIFAKTYDPL